MCDSNFVNDNNKITSEIMCSLLTTVHFMTTHFKRNRNATRFTAQYENVYMRLICLITDLTSHNTMKSAKCPKAVPTSRVDWHTKQALGYCSHFPVIVAHRLGPLGSAPGQIWPLNIQSTFNAKLIQIPHRQRSR